MRKILWGLLSLYIFLPSAIVAMEGADSSDTRKKEPLHQIKFFGADIDFMAWGTMPVLYFDIAEFDLHPYRNSSIRLLPYAFECTGYERGVSVQEAVSKGWYPDSALVLWGYYTNNFLSLIYEHYFSAPSSPLPPPKLVSLYVKAAPLVLTYESIQQKQNERELSSGFYWTPYLEAGVKMFIGMGSSEGAFYWSILSTGILVGAPKHPKMAKFNGNGFFINFDFCLGYMHR
jgi:hypothetical protein